VTPDGRIGYCPAVLRVQTSPVRRGSAIVGVLAAAVLGALFALTRVPEPELASGTPMKIVRYDPDRQ
jgi:hypothetical protein